MASLIGKALGARAGGPPVPLGGGMATSMPGMGMGLGGNTDLTAMRAYRTNGTVRANVWLLASAAAAQQWKLYRTLTDGRVRYTTADKGSDQRQQVVKHAALNLLENPAPITVDGITIAAWTRPGLMEISGIWLKTTGKAHWVVDWAGGVPVGLWPVRPDRMIPVPSRDRYLAGWVYRAPDGQELIPLRAIDVIYNHYPDPEDPLLGCGPVATVLNDIQASGAAAEFNRNFFANSAEPGGVIQVDSRLEDEDFNSLVDRWRESHRGVARAHRIAVLEQGATWVPNVRNAQRDMDFVNGRNQNRDIIREALAMHKVMTGVTDDVNRANAQTGEEIFDSWQVAPELDRWRDQVFNPQLLPLFGAPGKGVEFDYDYPTAVNREQDALELATKTQGFLTLITAGVQPAAAAEFVGMPEMAMVQQATQQPALPPGWVATVPGGGAEPDSAQEATQEQVAAVLRERAGWVSPAWDRLAALTAGRGALNRMGMR